MKVVEVKNLCLFYNEKGCEGPANWAGLYIIKQLVRIIQLKALKDAVDEVELWIPENIVKGIDSWFKRHGYP